MNYGGSGTAGGNYGQHQMGMGQPQQMLNQQQQMQMGMGQQPPGGVPNPQQRMMMQGMRQHPGYPPGMMPGVQNVPMYPGSAQQSEIVKHWPPSWKAELQQEKNPEKRKIMMKRFFQQWEHICRQNPMYPPSVMGGQGMTPGAPHPGQMGMFPPQPGAMQPGAMPGMMNPMMAQQNKMMPGQQPGAMAMQMRMQGQMPGQAGPGSVQSMIPPSATPQPASVQQMSANMSVPSPSAALLGQSPQVINPSTPQNPASVQPGSIDVANPASQQDPDYIKLLIEFKKHGDMLKKVGERCDRDKKPLPKAYDKLLEIADEKRTVTKELLGRLLKTTQQILESNSLIHPVLEVCKMYSCQESASSPQKAEKEKTLLNPFSVVSQQFIRVPDEILENLEQEDVEFETAMKRKASEVTEVPTKRTRLDMETEKRTDSPPRIEAPTFRHANSG